MADFIDRCELCIHDEVCDLWDTAECQDACCYSQLSDGSCGCYRNKNDVAPIKRGEWIMDRLVSTSGGTYGVRRCSLCEAYYQDVGCGYNYCPNCGANMEVDGE